MELGGTEHSVVVCTTRSALLSQTLFSRVPTAKLKLSLIGVETQGNNQGIKVISLWEAIPSRPVATQNHADGFARILERKMQ